MALFKYFHSPYTTESLKTQFREQSQKLHPDKQGGNENEFKEMKDEFDRVIKFAARGNGRRKILRNIPTKKDDGFKFNAAEKEFIKDLREFALFAAKNIVDGISRKI